MFFVAARLIEANSEPDPDMQIQLWRAGFSLIVNESDWSEVRRPNSRGSRFKCFK
jgi:hypothetical protein